MVNRFIGLVLLVLLSASAHARLVYFNSSKDMSITATYKICHTNPSPMCTIFQETPEILPNTALEDDDVHLLEGTPYEMLFITSVKAVNVKTGETFVVNYHLNKSGFPSCYAYEGWGMKFDVFPDQQKIFCTGGAG